MSSARGKVLKGATTVLMVAAFLFAAYTVSSVTAYANEAINVTIDGVPVQFAGQQPAIIDERTLVPVRGVFERLGFYVTWDGAAQQATLARNDFTVIISVGSATFTTNGATHTLDVPAQIIGGSTMLPIRAVLESVGYSVSWDGAASTVLIGAQAGQQAAYSPAQAHMGIASDLASAREVLRSYAYHLAAGRGFTVGIAPDNTVLAAGTIIENVVANIQPSRFQTELWQNITAVAAGEAFVVGLRADGTVMADYSTATNRLWTWLNEHVAPDVDEMSAADLFILATEGPDVYGVLIDLAIDITFNDALDWISPHLRVYHWSDIVQIDAGGSERRPRTAQCRGAVTVGLRRDGTVVATGSNDVGQIDVGGWRDIVQVSTTGEHTVGLRADGTVVATGSNNFGQLNVEGWSNIVEISTIPADDAFAFGGGGATFGLRADGTVVRTYNTARPSPLMANLISEMNNWRNIVALRGSMGINMNGEIVQALHRDNYQRVATFLDLENVLTFVHTRLSGAGFLVLHSDGITRGYTRQREAPLIVERPLVPCPGVSVNPTVGLAPPSWPVRGQGWRLLVGRH